ncbi:MAG: PAS domain S-box protein [Pseudomonadales bacterium]|nr:PAS domain S-box protein [Pseudomonadales bacterium]
MPSRSNRIAVIIVMLYILFGAGFVMVSQFLPASIQGGGIRGIVFLLASGAVLFGVIRSILAAERAKCENIMATSPLGMYSTDGKGVVQEWNPAMEKITGWTREEVHGSPLPMVAEEHRASFEALQEEVLETGQVTDQEALLQRKDGSEFKGRISASVIPTRASKSSEMFCILRDMTSHVKAEQERTSLTQAMEQATESVIITDTEGNIEYVNPAFVKISGYSRVEVLGQNVSMLESDKGDVSFYSRMANTLDQGEVWEGKVVSTRKDGSHYTEFASVRPVMDDSGNVIRYIAVKRDLTDELMLTDQLNQAQKMEVVGRLAGGIAHDFNNMLGIILGNTELILARVDEDDPLREDLKEVGIAAQRSANLTRQLLAFSRRQQSHPEVIDFNRTVPEMLKMLNRLIGEDIDLMFKSTDELWPVRIDPTHVDQILANLAVNARDAIHSRHTSRRQGIFRIRLDNIAVEHPRSNRPGLMPGEYVVMKVSDNGEGMTDEVRARAFEPFFTTKSREVGTGLGLATVYGVVKQNEGYIYIDSEPRVGTTFTIYLPRYEGAETVLDIRGSVENTGGKETILLVEDEVSLLKLARRMLERSGYTVLVAQLPKEAIQVAKEYRDVDLLLTDVIMPGMDGYTLWQKVREIQPDIKVLFTSGYNDNLPTEHRPREISDFLQKPYTSDVLSTRVRRILDQELAQDHANTG